MRNLTSKVDAIIIQKCRFTKNADCPMAAAAHLLIYNYLSS